MNLHHSTLPPFPHLHNKLQRLRVQILRVGLINLTSSSHRFLSPGTDRICCPDAVQASEVVLVLVVGQFVVQGLPGGPQVVAVAGEVGGQAGQLGLAEGDLQMFV